MDPEYVRAEGYEHKRIQGRVYIELQTWTSTVQVKSGN